MAHTPELDFQRHIANLLGRVHGYGVLEQADITDTEHFIAEDLLWAFLNATQADTLKKLSDDYSSDARDEVFKALRNALAHTPLWMLLRGGLQVRGLEFRLFYPKPRSAESAAVKKYDENRISFRPHFYFADVANKTNQEIDFVLFLNGLPIVALELKHEKNQTVHDAVAQFVGRDHQIRIFQHPFLYLAADTCDVKAATDPRREQNFRWHNTGLSNEAITQDGSEYPVEFLYREVLAKDSLLEALSFFLIRVPHRDAVDDVPERPTFTLFPRYHQSRLVRKVAADISACFAEKADIGRKYLVNHSAGSGKTLTICWLADRLHSLFKPGTSEKLVDMVFILTDRKSLDTNIKDEIENFTHLKDVIGLARKADDLPRFMAERRPIIVTTQQKFAWVLEQIENKPELKQRRVAFLIDEAHRSQEGQMGAAIRLPFRAVVNPTVNPADEADDEPPEPDPQEALAKIIREHDINQMIVAFTATPAPATVSLFGEAFDTYTEEEAIAEGYIVDVATSIISYKTLYNLHCAVVPKLDEEQLYPMGVVSKALQNVAFQDDGLIQYKAEVMLRLFEADVMPLIGGRAKAMIVTNKFQTGFDQPLLAGMFLDKPVLDRNAVQTVSRLNRCFEAKDRVVVVDFTNNARAILKAFVKYRKGAPFEPEEPDPTLCQKLHAEIIAAGVFTQNDASDLGKLLADGTDAQVQFAVNALRKRFQDQLADQEARKGYVYQLARYVKHFHFLTCFFTFAPEIKAFATFAEYVGPQLIKAGSVSELMMLIRQTEVIKAAVEYQGVESGGGSVKLKPGSGKKGAGPAQSKVSVQDMIAEIQAKFAISDKEALYIKQVTEEKTADPVIQNTVLAHRDDGIYLEGAYRVQVNGQIQSTYGERGRYEELSNEDYIRSGGIFDIMAVTVIRHHLAYAA